MTTNYWNYTKGESVPSGGANQLNTAASQGSNLGNWLSKIPMYNTVKEKYGVVGIVIAVIVIIALIAILRKKRRK